MRGLAARVGVEPLAERGPAGPAQIVELVVKLHELVGLDMFLAPAPLAFLDRHHPLLSGGIPLFLHRPAGAKPLNDFWPSLHNETVSAKIAWTVRGVLCGGFLIMLQSGCVGRRLTYFPPDLATPSPPPAPYR